VAICIRDGYWTRLRIWVVLPQAAIRAPVILLVVYGLGALGAKNRGMYFPPGHPLQVFCCAESWKGCRYVPQSPSSDITSYFDCPFCDFFFFLEDHPNPPELGDHQQF